MNYISTKVIGHVCINYQLTQPRYAYRLAAENLHVLQTYIIDYKFMNIN